ncbi:MAG TPA: acyl-CoA thioesterase [Rhodanobacteraceae bacterium]
MRLAEIVFPHHCNHLGTLFGGQALAWMDKAAFLASSRYAHRTTVTACSERIDFKAPIRLGDTIEIVAALRRIGRTSLTVDVTLLREGPDDAAPVEATRGTFVMVAVDAAGKPVALPFAGRRQPAATGDLKRDTAPADT